ncbi:DUF4339 domain-containing protein [Solimonas sp. SE-A11]|uniref:DUF4339 domain-containing protein n=1 Tax=Solimonas sp. SE-A11 TaxID=3054954 RepID=UPI00259CE673|nr:DUF4339 domain-containing protein [Solimonas sp. SE-A11]MDM4770807.1 DUF4339 domain-containing protein [Solimonas sp. SE-A11]
MQEGHDSGTRVWWYANGTQQQGPVSAQELKRIAAGGGLQPDALLWREGMAEWIAASSVRGLLPVAEATHPASPASPPAPPPPPPAAATEGWSSPAALAPAAPPTWATASASAAGDAPWFAVAPRKLLVMSLCTLTFYNLYWFYQQWWRVRRRDGSDIRPFWRTAFAIFYVYPLFKRIRAEAQEAGLPPSFEAGTMASLFIVITLLGNLPGPLGMIAMLSALTLMPAQELANRTNAQLAPEYPRNDRYSGLNITGIVLGGLMLLMALFGSFLPEEETEEAPRRKPSSSAPVALAAPGSPQA